MSFGAAIGGAATSGLMNNAFSSVDNFHAFEAENNLWVDWFGTALGKMNAHAENKKAKKQREWALEQMELQYAYQKRAALEMPALVRKGYEDAGYNALLALGQTGGAVNAAPKAEFGDYPHEQQRRDDKIDPLLMSALSTQAAQREKIKADTTRTKVGTVKDVLSGVGGILGGLVGLKALASKTGLLAAMTANAAQGSPVDRAAAAFKNGSRIVPAAQQTGAYKQAVAAAAAARSARMLNNLGKFGSAASLVGLTALVSELGNIAKSKGLPTEVTPAAEKKARDTRYGKPSDDVFNPRRLNFDAIRKNKRWTH